MTFTTNRTLYIHLHYLFSTTEINFLPEMLLYLHKKIVPQAPSEWTVKLIANQRFAILFLKFVMQPFDREIHS